MKYKLIITLIFIFGSFCAFSQKQVVQNTIKGEPKFYFGIFGGINYSTHSTDFSAIGPEYFNCCTNYDGASGLGSLLGVLFEYPINDKFSFVGKVSYDRLNAAFSENEMIGNVELVDPTTGQTVGVLPANVDYNIDATIDYFAFKPQIKYSLFKNFWVQSGLNLGFLLNGNFSQSEVLDESVPYNFANEPDGRRRNVFDNENLPDLNSFQFFFPIGISYDLVLKNDIKLTPEINYNFGFSQISNSSTVENWRPNYLDFTVALKFPIREKIEKPIIRETNIIRDTTTVVKLGIERDILELISKDQSVEQIDEGDKIIERTTITENYQLQVAKSAQLDATFAYYGLDDDGNLTEKPTVVIEEIETEQEFPLLPYVFFPDGESDLQKSGLNLLDNESIKSFDDANLDWNTLEIYSDMLNIVGKRMIDNPEAKLTITGTNNNTGVEANNIDLSNQRASSVKKYLTEVWNIEPKRINTSGRNLPSVPANNQRPEGLQENKRAELTSNNELILATVSLKDVIKKANPPVVRIKPSINSEAGTKNWSLDIKQDGELIRNYSGGSEIPEYIDWSIETDPIPSLEKAANISLSVTDKFGQTKSYEDNVDIKQLTIRKKRTELFNDKIIEKYALILFDYDKAALTNQQKQLLTRIKNKIKPNAKVIVTGYADRTGDAAYNKELAGRRAQEVINFLGLPASQEVVLENMGSSQPPFENETPVGRSYSRTVVITVETPVE